MKKKTILFIFHQSKFEGGASRSLVSIILKLKKEKRYNLLVLLPKEGEITNYLRDINIDVFVSNYKWSMCCKDNKWLLKKFLLPIFNKFYFYKNYNLFKNKKIDLIYSNTSVIENGFYLSKKIKCRHIYHIREFGKEDHQLEYLYSDKYRKNILNSSNTRIITISKALKLKYEKLIDRKDIELVYNGVENDFLEKKYTNKQEINFLLIGNINIGKNQIEALKAAKELLKRGYNNFKINFVGSENQYYKKELQNYIIKNKLESIVRFSGEKKSEDIKKIINYSDVGLMLSINEAFGRVTVEYMLGGLPVIGTNTGANPEIIKENENGYLYKIGNIDQLADKMEIFLKNYKMVEKIGRKAKEISEKKYTAEINYKRIRELIEKQFI